MRNLERNKRGFYYCTLSGTSTIVDTDGYDTGEPCITYSEPVYAKGNISPSGGTAYQEQFGLNVSCDKVIQLQGTDWPIDESTILFLDSVPPEDFDGTDAEGDYAVVGVTVSLNQTSIAAKRVRNG